MNSNALVFITDNKIMYVITFTFSFLDRSRKSST